MSADSLIPLRFVVVRARLAGDFQLRLQGPPGRRTGMIGIISKRKAKGACSRAARAGVPEANTKRIGEIFLEAFTLHFGNLDAGGAE